MARKSSMFRLSCNVRPETYQEVARLIERGLWPNRAAFIREAIEAQLQRVQIRDRLISEGIHAERYPGCPEDLLAELRSLRQQVTDLRHRIGLEKRTPATWLIELCALREKALSCYWAAEILPVPAEVVQTLRGLVDESSSGPSFHKAELALNAFWEYLKSPFAGLPKSDVETWREVSQIAEWSQSAHTELTRIAFALTSILLQLRGVVSAGGSVPGTGAETVTTQEDVKGE